MSIDVMACKLYGHFYEHHRVLFEQDPVEYHRRAFRFKEEKLRRWVYFGEDFIKEEENKLLKAHLANEAYHHIFDSLW